jgi:hypothetical protein
MIVNSARLAVELGPYGQAGGIAGLRLIISGAESDGLDNHTHHEKNDSGGKPADRHSVNLDLLIIRLQCPPKRK